MPKLDPKIEERVNEFLERGHIAPAQAEMLKAYYKLKKRPEAAREVGIKIGTFNGILSELTRRGVLVKPKKGCYQLTEDETQIKDISLKIIFPPDPPVVISDEDRTWMLKNYSTFGTRTEIARHLKRSKMDVIRMAIALGIDRGNR
ncbi:hypothetical protein EJP82_01010 [Paenibacillus anaericanus]|uniref:Uncharacterized protein n=1 Tax=Paenibacillus anaericanus TaxID=170367 RepID=A0A433YFC9_9BACL|nr:hypothetical protein [Paenibacillus anaericanus]RUT48553.1 hypothetical protein EJP82_01010 [Paenibacillus anaericanus]